MKKIKWAHVANEAYWERLECTSFALYATRSNETIHFCLFFFVSFQKSECTRKNDFTLKLLTDKSNAIRTSMFCKKKINHTHFGWRDFLELSNILMLLCDLHVTFILSDQSVFFRFPMNFDIFWNILLWFRWCFCCFARVFLSLMRSHVAFFPDIIRFQCYHIFLISSIEIVQGSIISHTRIRAHARCVLESTFEIVIVESKPFGIYCGCCCCFSSLFIYFLSLSVSLPRIFVTWIVINVYI